MQSLSLRNFKRLNLLNLKNYKLKPKILHHHVSIAFKTEKAFYHARWGSGKTPICFKKTCVKYVLQTTCTSFLYFYKKMQVWSYQICQIYDWKLHVSNDQLSYIETRNKLSIATITEILWLELLTYSDILCNFI